MNTKTKNSTFFVRRMALVLTLVFLFSISLVSANSEWINYGGGFYKGLDDENFLLAPLFFSSPYPQGNINFTIKTISQNSAYFPIIYDMDSDGQNEVYLIGTNNIYQYNERGNIVTSISVGTICGNGVISNNNGVPTLVLLTDEVGGWKFHEFTNTLGTLEESDSDLELDIGTLLCDLSGGIDYTGNSQYVFTIKDNNNVWRYDVSDNSLDTYVSNISETGRRSTEVFKGGISFIRAGAGASNFKLVWASKNAGTNKAYISTFDTVSSEFHQAPSNNADAMENVSASAFVLGSQDASPKLLLRYESSNLPIYNFYDINTNYLNEFRTTMQQDGNTGTTSWFCVGDVDYDGLNEFCYVTQTSKFRCLDESLTTDFEYTIDGGNGLFNSYFGCAEYSSFNNTGNESTLEIISDEGVYVLDHVTNKTHQVYDFDVSNHDGASIPVSIKQKGIFTKDILWVSPTQTIYYISSGTPAVCGNGLCEIAGGENSLTCFADCGGNTTTTINDTLGQFGYLQECSQDSDCFGDLVCTGGLCSGKSGGASCTQDFECISGDCTSFGFCGKSDFVDIVNDGTIQLGFTSTASKAFLALLMILLGAGVGAGIFSAGGAIGAVVGGVVGLFLGSVISVLVFGWIGVAVVFIILFVTIVIVFLSISMRGG